MRFAPLEIKSQWPILTKYLPVLLCEDTQGILAITDDNDVVGACVMDSWTETSVQVHIWIHNPFVIKHGFLRVIADHVFNTCQRDMMIGLVPSNNEKALKFDKHIGFTEVYRVKDAFKRGVDYVILEMRREDCRWLEDKNDDGRQERLTENTA